MKARSLSAAIASFAVVLAACTGGASPSPAELVLSDARQGKAGDREESQRQSSRCVVRDQPQGHHGENHEPDAQEEA